MSDCDLDKVSSYQRWKQIQSENIEALESVRLPAINQSTNSWKQQPFYGSNGQIGNAVYQHPRYYNQPCYQFVPAVTQDINFDEQSNGMTQRTPHVEFETSDDCKSTVNFIELNKRKMIDRNRKKYIYPTKSYTEMYARKRQHEIGYTNCNKRNIFGGTSTFLPFTATNSSRAGVEGPQSTRDKVKHANCTQQLLSVQQHTMQVTATGARHLPAITTTQSQSTTAGLQKVNIDINLRLAADQQVGNLVVNGTPQFVSPRRLEPLQQHPTTHALHYMYNSPQ